VNEPIYDLFFVEIHLLHFLSCPKLSSATCFLTSLRYMMLIDVLCFVLHSASSDVGNMNETVRRACHQPAPDNVLLRDRQETGDGQIRDDLAADGASPLPETLRHLVLFWEELSQYTLKVIEQNLISPSIDIVSSAQDSASVNDKISNKAKSSAKKSKDGKLAGLNVSPAALALRGNLFGAAAGRLFVGAAAGAAEGGMDKEMPCELCGGSFAHPVTYHMRQMHPGCGQPAGGQGYNSGGNFCGGWAGNCGDGGLGGSTWYLMCEKCRSRYLADKRKGASAGKEKVKKTTHEKKRPNSSVSQLATAEPHVILRNNAMFILELTDGTSSSHLIPSIVEKESNITVLPILTEDGSCVTESTVGLPFRQMPFLYLDLYGSYNEDFSFTNPDMVYCRPSSVGSGIQLDRSHSVGSTKLSRSRPQSTYGVPNGSVDNASVVSGTKTSFQRSISEMGGIGSSVIDNDSSQTQHETTLVGRRRNNSVGDTGGMSLLKRPSSDMSRLIKATECANDLSESIFRQPVVSFVMQRHDLDALRRVMLHAARRAACRTYALQALNWLVRNVAHPGCLHHLLWNFVSAMHISGSAEDEGDIQSSRNVRLDSAESSDVEQDVAMCSHPLTDVVIAGEAATQPLIVAFHSFLQTVADMMMHVPLGSTLQRIAVRCWSLRFRPTDHTFLHRCHVFSNISQILSKSDDRALSGIVDSGLSSRVLVECLHDLTSQVEVRVSSRQAMVAGMTDGSTETFWESGDEDKNKNKVLSITSNFSTAGTRLRVISLHIDNARDLGNKVTSVSFSAGPSWENMCNLRHADVDPRHAGWVSAWVSDTQAKYVRIELKGPDNSLRIRQIKLLGEVPGTGMISSSSMMYVQQRECEAETLSVFRLLTSLVFGQLVSDSTDSVSGSSESLLSASDVDLKEHMVGILFSRSGELTKLQRQVCSHIVGAIRRETTRVRVAWQQALNNSQDSSMAAAKDPVNSDAYCFELLSLVLALSGSAVGRRYVAQQFSLIEDLVSLLHTASPRVQRQIIALIRRILPDITPRSFGTILGIGTTIPVDLGTIARSTEPLDCRFVLDVFLACIAKSLTVHIKLKLPGVKAVSSSVSIASCSSSLTADQWWLRGSVSAQLAETMIVLLTDMVAGKLGSDWASVTKVAIATPIIGLSRLSASLRSMEECVRTTTLWLALAALCVLGDEHVDQLSTGRLSASSDSGLNTSSRPMCANHDDDETLATVLCTSGCGSLCSECDRILHLSKRVRQHQRQVSNCRILCFV